MGNAAAGVRLRMVADVTPILVHNEKYYSLTASMIDELCNGNRDPNYKTLLRKNNMRECYCV